jgi:hypothetical protein
MHLSDCLSCYRTLEVRSNLQFSWLIKTIAQHDWLRSESYVHIRTSHQEIVHNHSCRSIKAVVGTKWMRCLTASSPQWESLRGDQGREIKGFHMSILSAGRRRKGHQLMSQRPWNAEASPVRQANPPMRSPAQERGRGKRKPIKRHETIGEHGEPHIIHWLFWRTRLSVALGRNTEICALQVLYEE